MFREHIGQILVIFGLQEVLLQPAESQNEKLRYLFRKNLNFWLDGFK